MAALAEPQAPEPDLPPDLSIEDPPAPVTYGRPYRTAALQRAEQARRVQRLDRYEQMLALRAAQVPIAEMAKQVGIDARTVRRWVAQGSFPEMRSRRRRPSLIDPYEASVVSRWSAGCQNGMQLWEELHAKGYQGSIRALYHSLFRLRDQATPATQPPQRQRRTKSRKALPPPGPYDQFSAKHAVWLFVRPPEELKATEQEELTDLAPGPSPSGSGVSTHESVCDPAQTAPGGPPGGVDQTGPRQSLSRTGHLWAGPQAG